MITVILNCYKRPEYLQEQIAAIQAQTVPVSEIRIWYNRPEEGEQYNLDSLGVKVAYSNHNLKFHARFAYGLLAQTKYVAFFDDDTIPGPKWFESCLEYMKEDNYILGTTGVVLQSNSYLPNYKIGWNGKHSDSLEIVDLVGHGWFMERETLQYLWKEYPASWDNGEDLQLSALAYKYAGIQTAVPPHPVNDKSIWGSVTGMEKGNDKNASHWRSNHMHLRNQVAKDLINNGYIKVLDR